MQSQIWDATIPLHITHPSSPTPYLIQVPRLSYLPLLLPRLTSFFGPATSFSYEGILLKNLPVGLLCDLYQPELPWRLTLGDGPLFDIHDTFMNSVKEADFIRNGTAKGIMSMSKEHSTQLWNAVQDNDYASFSRINSILLNPPTALKHIPLRIYIPSSPSSSNPSSSTTNSLGSIKIIQTLIPPLTERREIQTLGSALNTEPILHGAPVPFRAPLEEVMREAAYADGWVHLGVLMIDA
ncbi:autophagy protein 5 [Mollisiaceae sp. DMI_Dod_QoI]|nr:autophagy protein 5 [Helotiales sp. DMI_Dod_QoI]